MDIHCLPNDSSLFIVIAAESAANDGLAYPFLR